MAGSIDPRSFYRRRHHFDASEDDGSPIHRSFARGTGGVQDIRQARDRLQSLDNALHPSHNAYSQSTALANPVEVPPWFIDHCRRAYLSIPFEGENRVLGITSAFRGEGRTSVAIGIATALAADTREQTLLLECDLERPSLCDSFNLTRTPGLVEWLDGIAELCMVRMPYLPELLMLPAGRPHADPARLFYQIMESNLVDDLKDRFRNIVVDLPPVLDVAYSALATRLAERLLVVVRNGKTPVEDFEKLTFLLGRERISGVVLNGTDFKTPAWLRRLL